MPNNLYEISINEINLDNDCYRTRYECPLAVPSDNDIVRSVSLFGVLNPPLLANDSNGYVIIGGNRRINAAIKNGIKKLFCRIIDDSILNIYKIAVVDNLYTCDFSEMDKAYIAGRIYDLSGCKSPSELSVIFEEIPGFRINRDYANRLLQINGFPEKIKESICMGFVSSSIVLEYDLSSDPDYERVLFFLENLKMGLNLQREFCNLVFEISKIRNTSMSGVLADDVFADAINEGSDQSKRRDLILNEMKKIRFPRLEEARKNFEDISEKLTGEDREISISRSKNLDSGDVIFSFSANSREKFMTNLAKLGIIAEKKDLDSFFISG